jgi:ankyrin repeat protein
MRRREFLRNGLLLGAAGGVPGAALAASQLSGNPPPRTGLVLPPLDDEPMFGLMIHAIETNHLVFVKSLIEQGFDVNMKYVLGNTPLHICAQRTDHVEILQYLISVGADVNSRDESGNTPLHYAIMSNNSLEVIQYLISVGADVHAQDNRGMAALDFAIDAEKRYSCTPDMTEWLRQTIALLRRAMGQE